MKLTIFGRNLHDEIGASKVAIMILMLADNDTDVSQPLFSPINLYICAKMMNHMICLDVALECPGRPCIYLVLLSSLPRPGPQSNKIQANLNTGKDPL